MRVLRMFLVTVLIGAGAVAVTITPAGATITVTTTEDENNTDGDCSLREAIGSINTGVAQDACGATTGPIILPAGTYPISANNDISVPMTIEGAGAGATILNWTGGVGTGSMFDIDDAGDFAISGVTMTGSPTYYLNKQCTNANTITVSDSVLVDADNYGINGCLGLITVVRTRVTGSGAYGVNNNSGSISLTDTHVADSGRYGVNANAGNIDLVRSTVSGSGDYQINANAGSVTLTNSTVSGASDYGINTNEGVITLNSSTVVGSYSQAALNSRGTASITNSIVVGGSGDACGLTATSGGFNIVDDDTCALSEASDRESTNPNLGPLADNGGFAPTHLPNPGSPAIDTGGSCGTEDQRGLPRPADGNQDGVSVCDRGAVEVQPPAPPAPPQVVTPTFTG